MNRFRSLSNPEVVRPAVLDDEKSSSLEQYEVDCHGFSLRFKSRFEVYYSCRPQMFSVFAKHQGQTFTLGTATNVRFRLLSRLLHVTAVFLDLGEYEATLRLDYKNDVLILARQHGQDNWTELGEVPFGVYIRFLRVASKLHSC
jgi:hypothetical protein